MPLPDALSALVDRVAREAVERAKRLRPLIDKYRVRHFQARLLFYQGEALKPEAEEWFDRLARENFVLSSAFHEDQRIHARNEGRRELALEIINGVGLSLARIEQLNAQLRREDDGGR